MPRVQIPLRAITAFEAAARLGSVTRAGEDLGVTQSAISRQLRTLEAFVAVPLFTRSHRQITLTAEGHALYEEVTASLRSLEAACRRISARPERNRLTVIMPSTFALKWLVPRLPGLKQRFPELTVNLRTRPVPEPIDFAQENADAAIYYGIDAAAPGLYSRKLCEDMILPVCQPEMLRTLQQAVEARDFRHVTILNTLTRVNDWNRWLRHFGVRGPTDRNILSLENSFLCYEAARKGLGVAIALRRMVLDDLAAGTLAALDDMGMKIPEAYSLTTPKGGELIRPFQLFEAWLTDELAETLEEDAGELGTR